MLEHEHSLRDDVDPAWALRPLALTTLEGRPALVLEDPGGEPLLQRAGTPMDLGDVLRVGAGVAAALRQLHGRGLIHKDIKPANVLTDWGTGRVWLRGFGIASRLPRERRSPEPPEFIAGTLAYMAPEQTGRMNRSIDSRSDLYALGVTFYEMLTGRAAVHGRPIRWSGSTATSRGSRCRRPSGVNGHPGAGLGDRHEAARQDGRGPLPDGGRRRARSAALPRAMGSATAGSTPSRSGEHDMPDRLLIPEKLYGRERRDRRRCSAPSSAWSRAARRSWCWCPATPGIGKSSLVNELHKALVPPRGLLRRASSTSTSATSPTPRSPRPFRSLIQ